MNVHEAIAARRIVRSYKSRPIEDDKLRRVLEAGRLAPSARNMQEWKFVVVRDKSKIQSMVEVCRGQKFVGEAGAVIVACALQHDHVMACGQYAYPIDTAIAVNHMSLAAVQEGLGSCWIGAFYEDKARELLGIPDSVRAVIVLTLGYPAESPAPKPRNPFGEVFCFDSYQA